MNSKYSTKNMEKISGTPGTSGTEGNLSKSKVNTRKYSTSIVPNLKTKNPKNPKNSENNPKS